MIILALETVTRAGSVALWMHDTPGPATIGDGSRTHGVRLPGEVQTFANASGLSLTDVDLFAVIIGPGSFTGLRVGLATVQGLAFSTNRRVIGVPTLEAMAGGWSSLHPATSTTLVTCLDAARGDLFYAAFDLAPGAAPRALFDPKVAAPDEVARDIASRGFAGSVSIVGDDVMRHAPVLDAALPGVVMDPATPNLAAAAARFAYERAASAVQPHALRPLYVRRTDAEVLRDSKGATVQGARVHGPEGLGARVQGAGVDRPEGSGPEVTVAASVFVVSSDKDVDDVARLQERAFGDAWGAEALQGKPSPDSVARLYAVRHRSGSLIAYCAAWKIVDELHINSLAVDPVYRRQGIATLLLTRVLALAAAEGATGATLEVRQSNEGGRALYHRLGFKVEGVRPGYYQNPREDALVLWKRGLGTS